MTKRVVMINGSPRPEGNMAYIFDECAKVIREEGLEPVIISLAGKNIHSCIDCRKCEDLKKCVFNDDGVNEIIEELRNADGLITGAPVYFGTARADIMAAVQRIGYVNFRGGERFLSHKIGGPIAVGRRGGHTATLSEMLMFYFINEMTVPGSCYWNMVFGREIGEAKDDLEGIETAVRFARNVCTLIKKTR